MPPDMANATIITLMKDEAPFLLHWVAYHRLIGFDRIIVFSNTCRDGSDVLLDRLAQMGVVEHHDNPVPDGGKPQPLALRRADKLPDLARSDWLIVLDVDEYIRIQPGAGHLDDLLSTAPQADGFALTWRMMGSAGRTDWTDLPVTQAYPHGAPDLFRRGWGVKTLFKPFADMRLGIHRPTIKGPDKSSLLGRGWVNGSAKPMSSAFKTGMWRSSLATLGYAHAEIAHYATQSREAFLRRDERGNANAKVGKYDAAYYAVFDRNEITPAPRGDLETRVNDQVTDWLSDPVLGQTHKAALAWHHSARANMRERPDYPARMADLARAAHTPLDRLDSILFTQPLTPAGKATVARMRAEGRPDPEIAQAIAVATARAEATRDAEDAAELLAMGVTPDHGDWSDL